MSTHAKVWIVAGAAFVIGIILTVTLSHQAPKGFNNPKTLVNAMVSHLYAVDAAQGIPASSITGWCQPVNNGYTWCHLQDSGAEANYHVAVPADGSSFIVVGQSIQGG